MPVQSGECASVLAIGGGVSDEVGEAGGGQGAGARHVESLATTADDAHRGRTWGQGLQPPWVAGCRPEVRPPLLERGMSSCGERGRECA